MLQLFRDDTLPPSVLCMLVTDGPDAAVLMNPCHLDDPPRMREAINALLVEHGQTAESLHLAV